MWQYDNATTEDAIKLAFKAGMTSIDTAESYGNQVGDTWRVWNLGADMQNIHIISSDSH